MGRMKKYIVTPQPRATTVVQPAENIAENSSRSSSRSSLSPREKPMFHRRSVGSGDIRKSDSPQSPKYKDSSPKENQLEEEKKCDDNVSSQEDKEEIIDYENFEEQQNDVQTWAETGRDYYEDVIFARGKKPAVNVGDENSSGGEKIGDHISAAPQKISPKSDSDDYEEVIVQLNNGAIYANTLPSHIQNFNNHDYENLDRRRKSQLDEALFSVGRRFPSIRPKKAAKKAAKVEDLYSMPRDKNRGDISESGSCARPVAAIYGAISRSSNLDLNGSQKGLEKMPLNHRHKRQAVGGGDFCLKFACCSSKCDSLAINKTKFLCAIIVVSVAAFIIAGSLLMYQSLTGSVVTVHPLTNSGIAESSGHAGQPGLPQPVKPFPAFNLGYEPLGNGKNSGYSWSSWSPWSHCSRQCLPGESQARTRPCLDPVQNAVDDLKPCLEQGGLNLDIRQCDCNSSTSSTSSSTSELETSTSVRYCDYCNPSVEVCVSIGTKSAVPTCRAKLDLEDPTGCGGICSLETQICVRLAADAFRCESVSQQGKKRISRVLRNGVLLSTVPQMQCPNGTFLCSNNNSSRSCISLERFCDNFPDCSDMSDEPNGCTVEQCNNHEEQCSNGRCVGELKQCQEEEEEEEEDGHIAK